MTIKEKYIGLQSKLFRYSDMLNAMGDSSCLFLCLCSITEEYFESKAPSKKLDIIEFAVECRKLGFIDDEWTCQTEKILNLATGVKWTKSELKTLPAVIPDEMYTAEKWFNKRTGYTHFRRRWGDTLDDSVTVREGKMVSYYAFVHK